jgi:hypothetical protein
MDVSDARKLKAFEQENAKLEAGLQPQQTTLSPGQHHAHRIRHQNGDKLEGRGPLRLFRLRPKL